ncbi:MAG: glucose-1-phosphate adenylyltransferase [Armatimonadetes bacterium]|nr:glucose-1-phosphate adenylyltransferase [Armatimonadota bacterium]MCX7777289.1 glucose-1-phosphate adenylyltransferase [Armatimonadota bacterium]
MRDVLTLILAGGAGQRLYPLTKNRAKPAVPFGGVYRIIDFTLSNCINSGMRRIYVLTQHKSISLDRHLREAWQIFRPEFGEFLETVPPQQFIVSRWYAGTADAVFQNIHLLEEERPRYVLILSGDHVYRMDYRVLLDWHIAKEADLTIACIDVERSEASRYGVMEVDRDFRVVGFSEKPRNPKPMLGSTERCLISMGIYVFRTESLVRAVIRDAKRESEHDFGKNIIPDMVERTKVFAFPVRECLPESMHYWRDIGTVDSYYDAHMELLQPSPQFDLFDQSWRIRTHIGQHAPTLISGNKCRIESSIISPGTIVNDATIIRSVISYGVRIGANATVMDSILLPGVTVGENVFLNRTIVDEDITIPQNTVIGVDLESDSKQFFATKCGVVVIPVGAVMFERR